LLVTLCNLPLICTILETQAKLGKCLMGISSEGILYGY
jgi:hypothetical protein